MNVYLLNKKPEQVINNVFMLIKDSFKAAILKEYFQGQQLVVTSENREELTKIVVASIAKFVSSEIKHVSSFQGIDRNKVREMFYVCIEKFLQEN